LRRVRFLETVRPALEKTRSEAADDAVQRATYVLLKIAKDIVLLFLSTTRKDCRAPAVLLRSYF
jgi:hypothetical protein